jgi:hypothetical protein
LPKPAAASSAGVEVVSAYNAYGDVLAVDGVDVLVRAGGVATGAAGGAR